MLPFTLEKLIGFDKFMNEDEIKQLQRQVSKLQLEAKLRKSVANELERQKNLVQKAKEDRQRFVNQATAYAQQVVPEARGRAQRQIEEAQAYRDRVIARSDGEAQRFEKLLIEYKRAPEVTRDRLYLDALETVFKNSSKVMVDVEGGNNMMYLPLDKMAQRSQEVTLDRDVVRAAVEELRRELSNNRSTSTRGRANN